MRRVRACCLAVLLLLAACGDSLRAEDLLTQELETAHFVFHMAPGDSVDSVWQESYFDWLVAQLGLDPDQKLHYYKYRDAGHLARVTGHGCCGYAESGSPSFHTIWSRDNHESVHALVLQYLGHPPALFNEGIAVAHHGDPRPSTFVPAEPRWEGTPVHALAADALRRQQIPALDELLGSEDFFRFPNARVYPLAGSFVRFLIDRAGIETLERYIAVSGTLDSPSTTRSRFAEQYGTTLDEWWRRWQDFLSAAP